MAICQVNFWTPIVFPEHASMGGKLLEWSGRYLSLGGEVAVVQGRDRKAILEERTCGPWETFFKVISYATVILPAIALLLKSISYCFNRPVFLYNPHSLEILARGKGAFDSVPAAQRGELFAPDELGNTPLHDLILHWERADPDAIKQLLIWGSPEQIFARNACGKTALDELFRPADSGNWGNWSEILGRLGQRDETLSILRLFVNKARPLDLIAPYSFCTPSRYFSCLGIPELLDPLFEKLSQLTVEELENAEISLHGVFCDLIEPHFVNRFPLGGESIDVLRGYGYALRLLNTLPPSVVSKLNQIPYSLAAGSNHLHRFIRGRVREVAGAQAPYRELCQQIILAFIQKVDRDHFFQRMSPQFGGMESPFENAVAERDDFILHAMINRFRDELCRGGLPRKITAIFLHSANFPQGSVYHLEQMLKARKKQFQKSGWATCLVVPSEAIAPPPPIHRSFVQHRQFERHLLPLILQHL